MDEFETEKAHIVKIQVVAALLTLVVSRAIFREFVDHAEKQGEECAFPTERQAATFRSLAQLILQEIAAGYGYPPPNSVRSCIGKPDNRHRHGSHCLRR